MTALSSEKFTVVALAQTERAKAGIYGVFGVLMTLHERKRINVVQVHIISRSTTAARVEVKARFAQSLKHAGQACADWFKARDSWCVRVHGRITPKHVPTCHYDALLGSPYASRDMSNRNAIKSKRRSA